MRTSLVPVILLLMSLFAGNAVALPDIQAWTAEKGARVYFVQNMMLPMVDVRIVFDAAGARDGDKPGLAVLTNGLLAEGAAGKDAQQLAESFESVGAQLDNDSLRDMAYIGVRTLTEEQYMRAAINTLTDVLTRPDFPEDAFNRELARMKVALKASKQSPSDIASKAFYKAIYGDHPYASPTDGTEESLELITLDDIKAFYNRYYVANNAVIGIVGAVDRSKAEEIANTLVANLPSGERADPLPAVQEVISPNTVRIDFPSRQSHIYVGQPGMKRDDKDYFKLYVANHPFGGSGFASRLVQVVREDRGLAYSVHSYFSPMRELGPFTMGLQTKAEQTDEALSLIRTELNNYIKEGPDKDEFEASISNITGGFPLNFDSNSKLLGYLALIGFYDLPLDYLDTYVDKIRDIDLDDVREVLQRRLHPDSMVTVIVGNGNGVNQKDNQVSTAANE